EVEGDDAERTGGNAVAAPIADVLLHHDGVELGANDRAGWARLHAPGVDAMLADVAHHEPVALEGAHRGRAPPLGVADALDVGDVPPGSAAQVAGVVVAVGGEADVVHRQLVPLLAGDLTRLAADAEGRVGHEA